MSGTCNVNESTIGGDVPRFPWRDFLHVNIIQEDLVVDVYVSTQRRQPLARKLSTHVGVEEVLNIENRAHFQIVMPP